MVKGGVKGGRGNNTNNSTRRRQGDRSRNNSNNVSSLNANEVLDELLFKDLCTQCKCEVKSGEDGLPCDKCNQWEHVKCVGYTNLLVGNTHLNIFLHKL